MDTAHIDPAKSIGMSMIVISFRTLFLITSHWHQSWKLIVLIRDEICGVNKSYRVNILGNRPWWKFRRTEVWGEMLETSVIDICLKVEKGEFVHVLKNDGHFTDLHISNNYNTIITQNITYFWDFWNIWESCCWNFEILYLFKRFVTFWDFWYIHPYEKIWHTTNKYKTRLPDFFDPTGQKWKTLHTSMQWRPELHTRWTTSSSIAHHPQNHPQLPITRPKSPDKNVWIYYRIFWIHFVTKNALAQQNWKLK